MLMMSRGAQAVPNKYDAVIIGGGINGCAVARKLSLDGKRVCLLERNDLASGTSSNSSKLIHGGLRYLESGRINLVRESLSDRKRLCELYPHLVKMEPFFLPVYESSPRPWWMIRTGLALYDLLSGQINHRTCRIATDDFADKFSSFKTQGLEKVYVYYDGKTDDRLLTREIAYDAQVSGCTIETHCQIDSIVTYADNGYTLSCRNQNKEFSVTTFLLINAAGPWIEEVNEKFDLSHNCSVKKVSGIHIEINDNLVPHCVFLQTDNQRIFFMIPAKSGRTLIGTTEREENSPCDDVKVKDEDIFYLLNCANWYLKKPLNYNDICNTYLGIRPLVFDKETKDITGMSREYKIDVVEQGRNRLVHIYGGKLTTCLSMAEKVAAIVT